MAGLLSLVRGAAGVCDSSSDGLAALLSSRVSRPGLNSLAVPLAPGRVVSSGETATEEELASLSASQEVVHLGTAEAAEASSVEFEASLLEPPRTGSSLKMLPVMGLASASVAPLDKAHGAGLERLLTSVQEVSRDNTFPPKPPATRPWSQVLLQRSRLGSGKEPATSYLQHANEASVSSKRAPKRRLSPLSPSEEAEAVKELKTDYFAVTTSKPKSSRRKTVLKLASKVKKNGPVFPLRPRTLEVVAAIFKKAKYRSGPAYLLELKLVHIEQGHAWTHQLDRVMQLCKKSLSRRLGPRKKAKEVLLQDACAAGKPRTKRGRTACNSVPFAKEAFLFAAIWILREIELNALDCDDVSFPGGGLVQLWLAESKTDPEAEGTLRTLQCVCEGACSQHCPLKVSADLVERAKAFHLAKGTKGPGSLCPTSGGGKASKEATVKAWQALFGKETTGHSPRRSGALHYIRQGHALQQVKHLGRWKSDVVFEYAKEAMACMPSFGRGEAKPQVEACGTVDS